MSSHFLLKKRVSAISFVGVMVTIAGTAVITLGDLSLEPEYFTGDILAIIGSVCMAAYLICGRVVRRHIDLTEYLVLVYGFAALFIGF
ncbi:hypothetical protein ACFL6I_08995 [candidate division KSB1 bacterium]